MAVRSIRFLLPAVAFVLSLTALSCVYDYEDCPDELPLLIVSDWHKSPKARPGGMAYIFFPETDSIPWRFDFIGPSAGKVVLPVGTYNFLSFNDDASNVLFAEEATYVGYEIYTASAGSDYDSGEKVLRPPGMMWGCAYDKVQLQYDGVNWVDNDSVPGTTMMSADFILAAMQMPLTAHYTLRIEDIENLSEVSSMSACLSGLAGSLFPATGNKGRYPSTLTFKVSRLGSELAGGDFYTFGIPAAPSAVNTLSIFVVRNDGRHLRYKFDVTEQVRSASDPMEVLLLLRGLSIDSPEGGSAGFDITVDGWETIEVNIKD